MDNPCDSLGETSREANLSSVGASWALFPSASSLAPPAAQVYAGQNLFFPPTFFPPTQAINTDTLHPYSSPSSVSAPGLINQSEAPGNKKVAIPRLSAAIASRGRRRSARACEPCRHRKSKCDGNRPTCGECIHHNSNRCIYEDVKRVRDQKRLELLSQRVERYESLLRSIEGEVDAPIARKIRESMK